MANDYKGKGYPSYYKEEIAKIRSDLDSYIIFTNCWHINEDESYLMWKTYGERGLGVVVKSTLKNLCNLITSDNVEWAIVNYEEEEFISNSYIPFINKRRFFKEEKELRLMTKSRDVEHIKKQHIPIKVDIKILIDEIRLHPKTRESDKENIKALLSEYHVNIQDSEIKKEPPHEWIIKLN